LTVSVAYIIHIWVCHECVINATSDTLADMIIVTVLLKHIGECHLVCLVQKCKNLYAV